MFNSGFSIGTGLGDAVYPYNKTSEYLIELQIGDGDHADLRRRIQFKGVNTEGQIASIGIELELRQNHLYGAGYRTARAEVDLGNLTRYVYYRILIIHNPDAPRIDFFVDSGNGFPIVPTGSLTNTNNIPNAVTADWGNNWMVISANNTPQAVDTHFTVIPPWINNYLSNPN